MADHDDDREHDRARGAASPPAAPAAPVVPVATGDLVPLRRPGQPSVQRAGQRPQRSVQRRSAAADSGTTAIERWSANAGAEPSAEPPDRRQSDVDEWGRSEAMRSLARAVFGPVYRNWFRAEWEGLEKIPRTGGALLIANHAGAIPSDAPVIMHGIEEELGRPVYGLADHLFRAVPVVGTMWSRVGGVPAHPENAYRLLREQQQLVLVFPEGTKGTGKTYRERYQLRRFGRGGFVEIAMKADVPIVPIAVVGAEESMPIAFKVRSLSRALKLPYWPVTFNQLVFGPLVGSLLYFPAKFRLRVLDPVVLDVPPDQERYSKSRIMDEAESIRVTLQEHLYDMLKERRSVWFG